jgi:hypothetical protein
MSSNHRQNKKTQKNSADLSSSTPRIPSSQIHSKRRTSLHIQGTPPIFQQHHHHSSSPDTHEESTELPESIESCKRITKTLESKINYSLSLFKQANSRYLNENRGETLERVCKRKDLDQLSSELDKISQEKDKSLKKITEIKSFLCKDRELDDERTELNIFSKICELKSQLSQLRERLITAESNIHHTEPDYINIVETFTQEILYENNEEPPTCKCVIV